VSGRSRSRLASIFGVVYVVEQLGSVRQATAAQLTTDERRAPYEAALIAMVAQRLAWPGSKLACHQRGAIAAGLEHRDQLIAGVARTVHRGVVPSLFRPPAHSGLENLASQASNR
jgi:hypothetical protein